MAAPKLCIPPIKWPQPVADLSSKLLDALSSSSPSESSAHPSALKLPVQQFVAKRDEAMQAITSASGGHQRVNALLSYQAQLAHLCTKLEATVDIYWSYEVIFSSVSSAFGTVRTVQSPVAYPSLLYDRFCVLYDLAAILAQDAGREKWSNIGFVAAGGSTETYNRAMEGFQKAAWLFEYLSQTKKNVSNSLPPNSPQPFSPEFSESSLRAMKDVCLALSMEVFWYKYLANVHGFSSRENQNLSKIAYHVSEYYRSAYLAAKEAKNGDNSEGAYWSGWAFPKEWISSLNARSVYFEAEAQWRRGREDLAANRYGEEITRLEHAQKILSGINSRKQHPELAQSIEELRNTINANLDRANKDNALIYLQETPPLSSLPSIDPKGGVRNLVLPKPISAVSQPLSYLTSNDGGFGPPIFDRLVPWIVHLGIKLYRDRLENIRADWERRRMEVEGEGIKQLADLGLPACLEAARLPSSLPSSLLKQNEEVRQAGGVEGLEKTYNEIKRQSNSNMRNLTKVLDLLEEELEMNDDMMEKWGNLWDRVKSEDGAKEHKRQAEELREKLGEAATVDRMIGKKWSQWEDSIGILSGTEDDLKATIPIGVPHDLKQDSASERSVRDLGKYMDDISDLRQELTTYESELKAEIELEDVKSVVELFITQHGKEEVKAEDLEPVFEKAAKKYRRFDKVLKDIELRQDELLIGIRDAKDRFHKTQKESKVVQAREKALQDLSVTYQKFREIKNEFAQAVMFHNSAGMQIATLLNATKEWYHVRTQEARELNLGLESNERRVAALTIEDKNEEFEEDDLEPPAGLSKTLAPVPPVQRKPQLYDPRVHGPPKFG